MSGETPEPELGNPPQRAGGADLIIPVLAAGLAIYFLVNTASLVWEARANGTVIGVVLLILVAVQVARVVRDMRRHRASLGFGSLLERSPVQAQRLGLLAIMTLFVATIPWVGTTPGLFVAMLGSMWLLGVRDPRILIGISLVVAAVVYVLFIVLLQSRLPVGPVETFISSVMGGSA
jgi:hypothetical protein